MAEIWSKDNNDIVYKGRVFSLRVGEAYLDNGKPVQREVIEHPGGVAVVPVLDDRSVILIRQFRISIGREILELPGGRLEADESPEDRARRELEEEIGYQAGLMVPVTSFYSAVGFSNLKVHVFLALDLRKVKPNPEWDENVQLQVLPITEVRRRLFSGGFEEVQTIVGLFGLLVYLQKQSNSVEQAF
jgi:ADP-ribose pyrophosphatase